MLSYPSSLQGRSDFPTPITPVLPVSSDLIGVYCGRSPQRRWEIRSSDCYLFPRATGLTPGSLPVLAPFASRQTMAFSPIVEDRRISCISRFIPQPDSPGYNCPALTYEAAPFALCCGPRIWLASLAGFDMHQAG